MPCFNCWPNEVQILNVHTLVKFRYILLVMIEKLLEDSNAAFQVQMVRFLIPAASSQQLQYRVSC